MDELQRYPETLLATDACARARLHDAADRIHLLGRAASRPTSPLGSLLVKVGRAMVRAGVRLQAQQGS